MRRFVTGQQDGEERFLHVEEFDSDNALVTGGMEVWGMWGLDEAPTLPFAGDLRYEEGVFHPAPGCIRANLLSFGPELEPDPVDAPPNAIGKLVEGDGMHSTDTLDIAWVISGEIGLELSSGEIEWLTQGDLLIQNGTEHKWHNRSGEPCLIGWVVLGARRERPDGS